MTSPTALLCNSDTSLSPKNSTLINPKLQYVILGEITVFGGNGKGMDTRIQFKFDILVLSETLAREPDVNLKFLSLAF